jgi:hypothetical protein
VDELLCHPARRALIGRERSGPPGSRTDAGNPSRAVGFSASWKVRVRFQPANCSVSHE